MKTRKKSDERQAIYVRTSRELERRIGAEALRRDISLQKLVAGILEREIPKTVKLTIGNEPQRRFADVG